MKNTLNHKNTQRRAKRMFALLTCLMLALAMTAAPALATTATTTPTVTGDALQAVSKLSDFIFSLIRAVGLILLGYGILQVGLSFQSHDPSQRSNGILTIAGGIIVVFTKELLNLITNAG